MNGMIYTVVIEYATDDSVVKVACENCDWKGTADQVAEINGAILTPGDESPAGRCPECAQLVYVQPEAP